MTKCDRNDDGDDDDDKIAYFVLLGHIYINNALCDVISLKAMLTCFPHSTSNVLWPMLANAGG